MTSYCSGVSSFAHSSSLLRTSCSIRSSLRSALAAAERHRPGARLAVAARHAQLQLVHAGLQVLDVELEHEVLAPRRLDLPAVVVDGDPAALAHVHDADVELELVRVAVPRRLALHVEARALLLLLGRSACGVAAVPRRRLRLAVRAGLRRVAAVVARPALRLAGIGRVGRAVLSLRRAPLARRSACGGQYGPAAGDAQPADQDRRYELRLDVHGASPRA